MVEGARLESVYAGNCIESSNLFLSTMNALASQRGHFLCLLLNTNNRTTKLRNLLPLFHPGNTRNLNVGQHGQIGYGNADTRRQTAPPEVRPVYVVDSRVVFHVFEVDRYTHQIVVGQHPFTENLTNVFHYLMRFGSKRFCNQLPI